MDPARCLVDGAGVARGLDEGLDEHGRGVVTLGPVVGQAPADEGEDVRTQVGDLDPGQDQEPRVEPMVGAVVREAARHRIDTPLLARLTAMIHEIEEGRRPLDRTNIDALAGEAARLAA